MNESQWISVQDRMPTSEGAYLVSVEGRVEEAVWRYNVNLLEWQSFRHNLRIFPTHWQPLPPPPKRESSFEKWWEIARRERDIVGCMMREPRQSAHKIWDAAAQAARSPDYVP